MGGLPRVPPNTAYVYKVILMYLPLTIVFSQTEGRPIQRVVEVFIQVMSTSLPGRAKAGPNRKYPPTLSFYVSTFYNWIWSLKQPRGASALHLSSELQGILCDTAILYIIVLQTSRKNW